MYASVIPTAYNTPAYAASVTSGKPQPVFSPKNAPDHWRSLPTDRYVVVDTEAHGLEARFELGRSFYCAATIRVTDGKAFVKAFASWESLQDYLQPLLDQGYALVCHNAKYDVPLLLTRGFRILWHQVYCTQVLSYLERNDRTSYSLDALTGGKLDLLQLLKDNGELEKDVKAKEFWEEDHKGNPAVLNYMTDYCIQDTKACHKLYKHLTKALPELACIMYHRVEQPMLKTLSSMECLGIPINRQLLIENIGKYTKLVDEYKEQINKSFGLLPKLQWSDREEQFVPKEQTYAKGYYKNGVTLAMDYYSPNGHTVYDWGGYNEKGEFHQHIADGLPLVVYDHCKLVPYNSAAATGHTWWLIQKHCPKALEYVSKTKTGKPQVNKEFISDVAEHLPEDFPIAKLAKATRRLQTLRGYWNHLTEEDRVHPDFNHTQTRTGRLSASNPNMQNAERANADDEETQVFRKLLQAPEGKRILVADLDQIELRVLAFYLAKVCGDKTLADEFKKPDADPHTANANRWGVKRTVAKTLIFLLIYGGQPALMVKRKLFTTQEEAEAAFASVHESQPAIKQLMEEICNRCRADGYITTIGGRRLYYPDVNSPHKGKRMRAERQCFNALIQGGARDIMHMLAVETQEVLDCYGLPTAFVLNQVHDELVVEVAEEYADCLKEDLNRVWQNRLDLLPGVRVNGDWNSGSTWYEAK